MKWLASVGRDQSDDRKTLVRDQVGCYRPAERQGDEEREMAADSRCVQRIIADLGLQSEEPEAGPAVHRTATAAELEQTWRKLMSAQSARKLRSNETRGPYLSTDWWSDLGGEVKALEMISLRPENM